MTLSAVNLLSWSEQNEGQRKTEGTGIYPHFNIAAGKIIEKYKTIRHE